MNEPREFFAAASAAGLIHALGGTASDSTSHEIYDPRLTFGRWHRRSPLGESRLPRPIEAAMWYAIGGLGTGFVAVTTVEMFDPATNVWITGPSHPAAIDCGAREPGRGDRIWRTHLRHRRSK
jgi:hypothetical protein